MADENSNIEGIKISQLDPVSSYVDLWTIGTDMYLHSVRVPLDILGRIGNINDLQTTDKTSLVAAINEAARTGGGGGVAVLGYVAVDSIANLPVPGQSTIGYLVGENLYLYVGSGGDTKSGAYQDCGKFRGPQGPQGIQGLQGPIGPQGEDGDPPFTDVEVEVTDNTSGTPSADAVIEDDTLTLTFHHIKGDSPELPDNLVYIGPEDAPVDIPPPTYEETVNKVTSLSAQSTDDQYPSAKCVYNAIQAGGGGGTDPDAVHFTAQTLTTEQKTQARTNIGAGTSNFSGSYNNLTDKPTIPTVPTISTNISTDAASDDKTASPKAVKTYADTKVSKVSSTTDNAIARYDGTSGALQDSGVTINDSNHVSAVKFITSGGTSSSFVKGDGSLDSSAYVEEGMWMMPTNSFGGSSKAIQINLINNGFYAADKRATVTLSGFTAGTASQLFDGNYETALTLPAGSTGIITIDSGDTALFGSYSYGYTYVSFYYNSMPQSVSMRVYGTRSSGGVAWYDLGSATAFYNSSGAYCYRIYNSSTYNCKKWEITIVAKSDTAAEPTQIDHQFTRGATTFMPVVTKFALKQDLYGDVVAPKFIMRGGTSAQFLKADGSVDTTVYTSKTYVDGLVGDIETLLAAL